MTYGYMFGDRQPDVDLHVAKGQVTAGSAIGILVLDLSYPYTPGSMANASSFEFPVMYECLQGASREILSGDPRLLDLVIDGGRKLQRHGVRAVVGACGYFAHYQKQAAAALDVPVFLSSLLQVPVISRALRPGRKVGIVCADDTAMSEDLLSFSGISDPASVVVAGAQGCPEMENMLFSRGHLNPAKLERELLELTRGLVADYPEIGAILLECSDFPQYALSIQNALGLPIFDFITMMNWIYSAVVRRPFAGFI